MSRYSEILKNYSDGNEEIKVKKNIAILIQFTLLCRRGMGGIRSQIC